MGIVLFGAFDRYNYGDILFPLVLTKAIKRVYGSAQIFYAGRIFADYTSLGGFKVKPLNFLKDQLSGRMDVIHVGGEILTCTSKFMMMMNMPQPIASIASKVFEDPSWDEIFASAWNSYFGYIDNPAEVRRNIYFNSVGGAMLSILNEEARSYLTDVLRTSSHLTVRDKNTQEQIKNLLGLDSELAPDSAVLIREYFDLDTRELVNLGGVPLESGSYFCIQVNHAIFSKSKGEFVKEIVFIEKFYKKKIVLVPIGTAAFHEDDIALETLHEILCREGVDSVYFTDRRVFEIMRVIRHSAGIICTSLHGRITALAFGVPRVTIFYGDSKQESYIQTWEQELGEVSIVKNGAISSALDAVLKIPNRVYMEIAERSLAASKEAINALIGKLVYIEDQTSNYMFVENSTDYNRLVASTVEQKMQRVQQAKAHDLKEVLTALDQVLDKVNSLNGEVLKMQNNLASLEERVLNEPLLAVLKRRLKKIFNL